ncbi:MAG: PD-(D/E)XK nuclease family protein [Bacteroidales bacterium]|nr:PD-(D/E)XK nuclease family protein [Bacteroidales bacterium]
MIPFLRQVARHYRDGAGDITRLCFVFPNRRALRFFEHYLGQEIAASGSGPAVAPRMCTISDFFCQATGERPSGRIELLLELYKCYKALNPEAEKLDDFIFWGDTLLGDFDDVDKYLVNPEHLFTNISDLKSIQDDYSYLTENQQAAIRQFVHRFLTPGEIKDRFVGIWRILLPLYRSFREVLESKGMSYEGMVYRKLAESLKEGGTADLLRRRFPWSDRFVFVGLNALNECEREILRNIHKAQLGEFCWDFQSSFIRNADNKSSFFLRDFVVEFPPAFEPDPEGLPQQEFNVLSVPGGIAQARQLPEILSRCSRNPGIETAVILPDEQLLIPVLNSIPEHIQALNVTMGYPIGSSQLWALISGLAALQMHIRIKDGAASFYHRQLWAVASNSIVRSVLSKEETAVLEKCRKERRFYISPGALSGKPVLDVLFHPVVTSNEPDAAQIRELCLWLQEVITTVAPLLRGIPDMQLELDFAKLCYEMLEQMQRYELELSPASFFRLLGQSLGSATVPFEGEPLAGMQIMGPLELRALDFENLIILSFNEGVFPRRSVSSSFIPPELRKGFGLPTYEYQDAVWAYYFYRAIQRASKVWMVYDSRAEGLKGGEPSRYLYQLEMHFGVKVNRYEASMPIGRSKAEDAIPKTAGQIERLRNGNLSASAMTTYFTCPARFFYSKVEGLKSDDEVSESLDAGSLGTVLHATMQELYPDGTTLDAAFLTALLKGKDRIRSIVVKLICKELKTPELRGRNLVLADVICSYAGAIIEADLQRVAAEGPFKIVGTEIEKYVTIKDFRFKGFIDRLDRVAPGRLRIVDYKTGKVDGSDLDDDPASDKVPKVTFQLYLYKRMLEETNASDEITGAIYQPGSLMSGGDVYENPLDDVLLGSLEGKLGRALEEIEDTSVPWTRVDDPKICRYCDFRAICGK